MIHSHSDRKAGDHEQDGFDIRDREKEETLLNGSKTKNDTQDYHAAEATVRWSSIDAIQVVSQPALIHEPFRWVRVAENS